MGIVMNIELTRDQYQALLKSLAITRFLYHSILDEEEPAADRLDSYDTFEEKTDISDLITEYQDSIFWDELIQRLAARDFLRIYDESEIKGMAIEERIEKEAPFISKYEEIFTESGIENLEIK